MLGTHISFFYYSGTGNTLLVVKEMAKVFSSRGISVTLHRIENTDPAKIEIGNTIGLAFPVAFQSTFPFVWDFFKALPEANGTPVFMVDTMMSFSGAIVGPLKKLLTSKGYVCIGAREIVMPSNWLPEKIDPEKNKEIISRGLENSRKYAEELIEGKTSWGRIPFLSAGLYHACCNNFVMKHISLASGRKITVDKGKCTKCTLCSKLCPVNNIVMNEYPQWRDSCEVCMRCLCFCPAKAIKIPGKEFSQYRVVKANELLSKGSE